MSNIVNYLYEVYSNRKKKIFKCQQKVCSDLTVLLLRTDTINSAGTYGYLGRLLHQVPDQTENEEDGPARTPAISLLVTSFRFVLV